MNCPNCGKEMEPGRMTAGGRPIYWVPEGESTLLAGFGDGAVTISGFSFSTKGTPAYICQTCCKVIADF